jgi:hypothetical protein
VAKTSQALGFSAVAASALEFGCRVASNDELVQFNRLRVSLQQSKAAHQDNSESNPTNASGGTGAAVEKIQMRN